MYGLRTVAFFLKKKCDDSDSLPSLSGLDCVRRLHTTAHMDGHGRPQVWVVGCMLLETVYVSCLTCFLHVSLDHTCLLLLG